MAAMTYRDFLEHCHAGRRDKIQQQLGRNPSWGRRLNSTAMRVAILRGHFDVCEILFEHSNCANSIAAAAKKGNLSLTMRMAQQIVDSQQQLHMLPRALSCAVDQNHQEIIDQLWPLCTDTTLLAREDVLFSACSVGNMDMVRELLLIPHSKIRLKKAMIEAARAGHMEAVAALLDHTRGRKTLQASLWAAARAGHRHVVDFLIPLVPRRDRDQACQAAALSNQWDLVTHLMTDLSEPWIIDLVTKEAADAGQEEIALTLLPRCNAVEVKADVARSAIRHYHETLLAAIIAANADQDSPNYWYMEIHLALRCYFWKGLAMLLVLEPDEKKRAEKVSIMLTHDHIDEDEVMMVLDVLTPDNLDLAYELGQQLRWHEFAQWPVFERVWRNKRDRAALVGAMGGATMAEKEDGDRSGRKM